MSDESDGRDFLTHIAKTRNAIRLGATTGNTHSLLERVASSANLAAALLHVARNKGAAGVDGDSVGDVVRFARSTLPRLRHALLTETYAPGDVRRVWIPKPGGGQRGLGIPNVVDRWVQQAVHQILEPIFDPSFHDCSHGFRSGRGAQTALADVREYLTEGQTFRAHLATNSVINTTYNLRPGQTTRNCTALSETATDDCPAIQKRIWPDGTFPAN